MRTLFLSSIFISLVLIASPGCGDDGGAGDTGVGTDTGVATDTGIGGDADMDTGTAMDTGTGTDAASDAAADALADASSDALADASADATSDAATDGGACATCIGAELAWGNTGGLVAFRRSSTLAPCRTYTLTEMNFLMGGTTMSCTNEVPCGVTDAITIGDVNAALAHADVVAAFAAAPITYGRDTRPVDGVVFEVSQSGATFLVGSPCGSGGGACTPIPTGVQDLVDLLRALDVERLAEPDCSTVFP